MELSGLTVPARFLILGSASPDLVGLRPKVWSGRVELVELSGLTVAGVPFLDSRCRGSPQADFGVSGAQHRPGAGPARKLHAGVPFLDSRCRGSPQADFGVSGAQHRPGAGPASFEVWVERAPRAPHGNAWRSARRPCPRRPCPPRGRHRFEVWVERAPRAPHGNAWRSARRPCPRRPCPPRGTASPIWVSAQASSLRGDVVAFRPRLSRPSRKCLPTGTASPIWVSAQASSLRGDVVAFRPRLSRPSRKCLVPRTR